jgi:YQGE family putative transporter
MKIPAFSKFFAKFRKTIKTELAHYRKLRPSARALLVSSAIYECTQPLLFLFINVFIWRQTNSFILVGAYNLGYFLTIPLFFFVNGVLLRYTSFKRLFFWGLVGQGIVVAGVFVFPMNSFLPLLLFGCLQGLPIGLYWGTRNLITIDVTKDEERGYYAGLEAIAMTLAAVTVPILFGWFIFFSEFFHLFNLRQSYQILVAVVIGLLVWAGWVFQSVEIKNPVVKQLFVKKPTRLWWISRAMEVCRGFFDRMTQLLPPLMVLTLIGKEGVLGTIQSVLAMVTIVIMYFLARKMGVGHRLQVLGISTLLFTVVCLLLAFSFSIWTVLFFLVTQALCDHIAWVTYNPIQMRVIEEEESGDPGANYAYVVDREFCLNVGRIIGIGAFFFFVVSFSQETALKFTPLVIAILQIFLFIFTALSLQEKRKRKTAIINA